MQSVVFVDSMVGWLVGSLTLLLGPNVGDRTSVAMDHQ